VLMLAYHVSRPLTVQKHALATSRWPCKVGPARMQDGLHGCSKNPDAPAEDWLINRKGQKPAFSEGIASASPMSRACHRRQAAHAGPLRD
jgi:hypothetical protein